MPGAFADLSELPPSFRKPFATFLIGFGALVTVGCVVGEVLVVRTFLTYPETPRRTTLEAARPGEWAEVTDLLLDCESIVRSGDSTYYVGRSRGGRPFVASYDRAATCGGGPTTLAGTVETLHPNLARTLERNRVVLPGGPISEVCTGCGPANTRTGALVLLAGILLGAALAWLGASERRKLHAGH